MSKITHAAIAPKYPECQYGSKRYYFTMTQEIETTDENGKPIVLTIQSADKVFDCKADAIAYVNTLDFPVKVW